MELRCDNSIKFGVVEGNSIEVKCRSSRCGAGPGIVVIHRFDLASGELTNTNRYRDPVRSPKG